MINLIPEKAKRKLSTEYWFRTVTVWMIVWSVVFVLSIFILLPTYVLIDSQVSIYEASADIASQKAADYQGVSEDLARSSVQARSVVVESKVTNISSHLSMLYALEGQGIKIKEVGVTRIESNIEPITLRGKASNRQALASFRDRVLALELVEKVDLPISNLARDKDIDFSITITLSEIN